MHGKSGTRPRRRIDFMMVVALAERKTCFGVKELICFWFGERNRSARRFLKYFIGKSLFACEEAVVAI